MAHSREGMVRTPARLPGWGRRSSVRWQSQSVHLCHVTLGQVTRPRNLIQWADGSEAQEPGGREHTS